MIKSVRCFFLRLRESEINFVFCEWVLFYPLATKQYTVLFLPNSHVNLEPRVSCALHNSLPRAKDGKRQKWQGLDVLAIFSIPLSATCCTHRLASRLGRCFCTKMQRSPPETRTPQHAPRASESKSFYSMPKQKRSPFGNRFRFGRGRRT